MLFVVVLVLASYSSAQVKTGTPPFGSFGGGPFDTINLANLNVHFTMPVLSKPGRGVPFTYSFQYDTSIWYPQTVSGVLTWTPIQNWGLLAQTASTTGWLLMQSNTITCQSYISLNHTWVVTGQNTTNSWIAYIDPFGSQHPLNATSTVNWGTCNGAQNPPSQNATVTSPDGSGYTLNTHPIDQVRSYATVTTRDGTVSYPPWNTNGGTANYTDRNGNQITVDTSGHFYDTMSSSTPVLTVAGSGTPSSAMTFTYGAPAGSAVFKLNYTNYTVATNFGISTIHEYKSGSAVPLVTSAVLADGSQYTFVYESTPSTPSAGACTPYTGTTCTTGRLASITLPTGGQITYAYSGGNNGIFSDGTVPTLTRGTPDGAWQYSQAKGSGAASTTTVTDPQGNFTVIQFQGIYETQRQVYSGLDFRHSAPNRQYLLQRRCISLHQHRHHTPYHSMECYEPTRQH
jgi:hypothetical protein